MATSQANLSVKQLGATVGQAVKAALQRNQVKTTSGFAFNPGILAGPILESTVDLKVAQAIADDITAQVQRGQAAGGAAAAAIGAPGQTLQSGVLVTHNHIICGFFPYPTPILTLDE